MFVPHARVRLTGLGGPPRRQRKKRNRALRRKLKFREHVRMPCLFPTCASCMFGLLILLGGTAMSFVGYHPMFAENRELVNDTVATTEGTVALKFTLYRHPGIKTLSYIGPTFMGCGLFMMIIAGVLYCEIIDKYVNIEQEKTMKLPKDELYDIIIDELRKNYFRGIEVPLPARKHQPHRRKSSIKHTLFKALSISTPALLFTPEIDRQWEKRTNTMSKKRRVDKPPVVIKLQELPSEESWVKTSSLPDIAPNNGLIRQKSASTDHIITRAYFDTRRLSKSCGNVADVFSESEIIRNLSSSCFDNPAYIPDPDRDRVISLIREQCKRLAKEDSKCSVHWDDECDINIRELHPLATKEELRLFDSTDEDCYLCPGSVTSLNEVEKHPLQASSCIECCECYECCEFAARCTEKRVSVIVHQASVHQSDDDASSSKMQRHSIRSEQEMNKSDLKTPTRKSLSGVKKSRPPLIHSRRVLSPDDPTVGNTASTVDNVLKHVDTSRVTHL